ncbi:hypothetical protein J437_LFUL004654 [Ladona fulva]|uniref:Uncharacterized protein n=1 Tax=Ladona fulva TaxID=123851 RepID=A0A8K0K244_LADFU|nr:hypothetical protein J437_LFUL004654 [Ladona fulva]
MFVGVPTMGQGQQHPIGAGQPAVGIPSNPFLAICPPYIPPGSNFPGGASPAIGQVHAQSSGAEDAGSPATQDLILDFDSSSTNAVKSSQGLSQQMTQMTLGGGAMAPGMGMGMAGMNASPMAFPPQVAPSGQTLSTNLWQ